MTKKSEFIYSYNFPEQPPQDKGRKEGENDTKPFIPKNSPTVKKTVKQKKNNVTDPRVKFLEYCDEFPIDYFQIPRPLRTAFYGGSNITDSHCALYALTLLGVPHDVDITHELKPIGWLVGPHLLMDKLDRDWSLTFDGSRLIYTLKVNPWLIVTDSTVQLALAILRVKCEQGTPRESKWAKQILKKIGVNLFIPESAKKRRVDEITLRYFSNNPAKLIAAVKLYEFVIRKFWEPPYKSYESQKKEEHCGEAFRLIFKKSMPPTLIKNEKNSSPANVALAFISYETKTQYTSLHKIFYSNSKEVSIKEVISELDLITDNEGEKNSFLTELKKQYTGN